MLRDDAFFLLMRSSGDTPWTSLPSHIKPVGTKDNLSSFTAMRYFSLLSI